MQDDQETKLPLDESDRNQPDSKVEAEIESGESNQSENRSTDSPDAAPPDVSGDKQEPTSTDSEAKPNKLPARLEATQGGVQAIIPRDLDQVSKVAQGIIASGIVPQAFKYSENVRADDDTLLAKKGDPNKPLIIMGIMKALEVGLAPLTGLSYLLPINDRFTIWGDGAVALAQSKRLIANQKHSVVGPGLDPTLELADWPNEYGHEVRYWRVGQEEPYVGRYTVGDAKRAGLWMNSNKKPWIKYPDRMLFNRARAFALRDGFADALAGLAIAEEVRDMTPEPVDGGDLTPTKRGLLDED